MRNTKKPIQLYRGTTQQHSDYAGPVGEITVDTEKYTVVVQNGVTGGVPLAREDTVVSLTNRIAAEESARATADTAIQKSVTDEVSARKAADTTLQNNIASEASARETADTALQKSITDEASARETADTALQKSITDEASARETADNALQKKDTALQKSITDEASARATADTAIQKSVTDEVSARKAADTALQKSITDEVSARKSADTALQNSITTEASARETADTALQNDIASEASARETADTALSNRLDVVEPVLVASDFTGDTNTVKKYVDAAMKNRALLASPAFSGTPTAPTADKGTNSTQIATTAFVQAAISEASGGYEPECVVYKEDEFQYGHIRYSSGLQICWGWSGTFGGGNGSSKTFTFAKPFKTRPHVFCTPCNGAYKSESYNAETSATQTTGTIKIWVTYGPDDKQATVAYNWLAIGFWK